MKETGKIRVLFIAGFGPIVHETTASRKLYKEVLGIGFKEENDGYLHTQALQGAKTFALWPLSQAAQACFGKDSWPPETPAPQAGSSLTLTVSKTRLRSWNRKGIECS